MNSLPISIGRAAVLCIGGLAVLLVFATLLAGGCREYNRYQRRADANNQVEVTKIGIRNAEEQAKVNRAQIEATKAEAEKRYQESIGIRRAQDEISKTLTPLYVQHEAIEQLPQARAIYVPSGPQGIPQVYDLSGQAP